jgi:hypothetical protein
MTLLTYADDKRNLPSGPMPPKTSRRVSHLRQQHAYRGGLRILVSVEDEAGRGAVAYQHRNFNDELITKVAFFEGGGIKKPFSEEPFTATAHNTLGLQTAFERALTALKDRKKAGHPYVVGTILADIMSYTSQMCTFYQVVAVPDPRSFEAVRLQNAQHSGDWMNGTVVPVLPAEGKLAEGPRESFKVTMVSGKPKIVGRSRISSMGAWDGKPVSTYSD